MGKLIHEELSYTIRGSLFRVYNTLGPGFREETYKQAAKRDLSKSGLFIEVEKEIAIPYENDPAIDIYRLDILVEKKILLELKAVAELHERFVAQTLSALLASKIELAMLVNFGSEPLEIRRLLNAHMNPAKKPSKQREISKQPDLDDLEKQKIIHKDLCYALYGCFYKVYNILGSGFRETTYEKALFKEMPKAGINYATEKEIPVVFDGIVIDTHKIKLVVDDKIIVYIKAYADLEPHWEARLKSELRASQLELGLIVNFGSSPLTIQRVLNPQMR
jgi:GxxExxY protein